jgi:hypothetical protein
LAHNEVGFVELIQLFAVSAVADGVKVSFFLSGIAIASPRGRKLFFEAMSHDSLTGRFTPAALGYADCTGPDV